MNFRPLAHRFNINLTVVLTELEDRIRDKVLGNDSEDDRRPCTSSTTNGRHDSEVPHVLPCPRNNNSRTPQSRLENDCNGPEDQTSDVNMCKEIEPTETRKNGYACSTSESRNDFSHKGFAILRQTSACGS